MGTGDSELYKPKPAQIRKQRLPDWHKMSPLLWAPFMYTIRFALQGRVKPKTQHTIFGSLTLIALSHAGYVMSRDSSM
eukprot:jgi/Picsp_1/1378/NSC_04857-R1_predicted protein [Micromonas sp. RCC299]